MSRYTYIPSPFVIGDKVEIYKTPDGSLLNKSKRIEGVIVDIYPYMRIDRYKIEYMSPWGKNTSRSIFDSRDT